MKGAGSVGREELNRIYRAMDARRAVKKANNTAKRANTSSSQPGEDVEQYGGWHNIGEEEVNGGNKV